MRRHALAFAAGFASATGFAPLGLWPVTLLAMALLLELVARAATRREALLAGYWFGAGQFMLGLNWIAGAFRYQEEMPLWLGWVAVALLSLYLAVFPALAAGLAWVWGRTRPLAFALCFAGAWIITEWLRARVFTGFSWNPLSVSIVDYGQISGLIGTYGASGLVVMTAGTLWMIRHRHWETAFWSATALALLVGGGIGLQMMRSHDADHAHESKGYTAGYTVRVVQPNIGQQDKHDETFSAKNFAKLEAQMGGASQRPRLILWPEAAVPEHIGQDDYEAELARAKISALLGPKDLLLLGNDKIFVQRYERGGALYERWIGAANSVFAMTPSGRLLWRYDKAHLVPYGEYLPARPILSALGLSRLVPGDLDFWPGPGPRTHTIPGFGKVGVQICYEIVFSGEVTDRANRADFIFNPSNDAWFGSWGSPQFVAQSRLRAMEEGLPVIRSTPTGISAIIDANGRVLHALPQGKAGFIEAPMPAPHAPTLFARYGNLLPLGFAIFLFTAGIALSRRSR